MSKILIVAEHDGARLNASTSKCVSCAAKIPGASLDVLVLAVEHGLKVEKTEPPSVRSKGVMVKDVAELVAALKQKGLVA
jgi:electron transfer flavoprotein alpha/beta subunit